MGVLRWKNGSNFFSEEVMCFRWECMSLGEEGYMLPQQGKSCAFGRGLNCNGAARGYGISAGPGS